jgi:poly(hydroxyalkanoate) granule-associated protein
VEIRYIERTRTLTHWPYVVVPSASTTSPQFQFPWRIIMAAAKKGKRRAAKRTPAQFNVAQVGHKVWLAGLGALARAQNEGPKLFESLVEEGSAVHERARDVTENAFKKAITEARGVADERVTALRGKANETWDNVEKIFQSRVHKALQQLGMPTSQEIRALTRKVDELTRGVEGLAKRERRTPRASAAARTGSATHSAVV